MYFPHGNFALDVADILEQGLRVLGRQSTTASGKKQNREDFLSVISKAQRFATFQELSLAQEAAQQKELVEAEALVSESIGFFMIVRLLTILKSQSKNDAPGVYGRLSRLINEIRKENEQ